MKPTPAQFLLGTPYVTQTHRYRFVRNRPHQIPRVEVRTLDGALIENPVVKTAAVAAYLENLT